MTNRIAVIGGTGALGSALARRWSKAGHDVVIGSRTEERAIEVARSIEKVTGRKLTGLDNIAAAASADIIVLTVPFTSHVETLESIRDGISGKLLVDTTVPLVPPKVAVVQLPDAGSAAVQAQRVVGDDVRVTSAFHNVAATKLAEDGPVDGDVLVFGDKLKDRELTIELVEAAELTGIHGGALANSAAAEAMTSVLISINKRYKSAGSALRITGIDQ